MKCDWCARREVKKFLVAAFLFVASFPIGWCLREVGHAVVAYLLIFGSGMLLVISLLEVME